MKETFNPLKWCWCICSRTPRRAASDKLNAAAPPPSVYKKDFAWKMYLAGVCFFKRNPPAPKWDATVLNFSNKRATSPRKSAAAGTIYKCRLLCHPPECIKLCCTASNATGRTWRSRGLPATEKSSVAVALRTRWPRISIFHAATLPKANFRSGALSLYHVGWITHKRALMGLTLTVEVCVTHPNQIGNLIESLQCIKWNLVKRIIILPTTPSQSFRSKRWNKFILHFYITAS